MNEGGLDALRLSIEIRKGIDSSALSGALTREMKEKFALAPVIVVLETGTLAREIESNIKAARFVDRRG